MEKGELAAKIVNNFGVHLRIVDESLSGLEEYDKGLRSRLFQTFDTSRLVEFIRSIETAKLYFIEDPYSCHYCFFNTDRLAAETGVTGAKNEGGGGIQTVIIGPWLETLVSGADIDAMLLKNSIPYYLKPELAQYFNHLPLVSFRQSWEGLLVTLAENIHDAENQFDINYTRFETGDPAGKYSPKQDVSLSMKFIETLYHDEDIFLNAIKAGDSRRALQCTTKFRQYRPPQRASEKIRDAKSHLLALNTLVRKAVQESSVHPMHIHTVSTDFARQIEATEREPELGPITETMIRRYCSLVQEYSLAKYSEVVRNIINTVEFNLKEPLSLSILSKQFNIDPSNLSHHFARETGMTLTDFINRKRLKHACHLLSSSAMYIADIAEDCGYQDINYFTRLFKRQFGLSPRDYRKSIQENR